ncbi:hypothetical protein MTR_6g061100 [Medicago truncatula]|uniref:Uncharacterized protein n=1 Tax=Medicago truncatula TaxID=3880 RepID=A0A072UAM2_MEDTR|nr:hypothetical protein MTR_6g061100 [Medicago truncatula]
MPLENDLNISLDIDLNMSLDIDLEAQPDPYDEGGDVENRETVITGGGTAVLEAQHDPNDDGGAAISEDEHDGDDEFDEGQREYCKTYFVPTT